MNLFVILLFMIGSLSWSQTTSIATIPDTPTVGETIVFDGGKFGFGVATGLGASGCLTFTIANEAVTGTVTNKLSKLVNDPVVVKLLGTTDTTGGIGIVTSGSGTTGSATICAVGAANCIFDNATTANHYFTGSTSVAGDCHDAGATIPDTSMVFGVVTETGAAGTRTVVLGIGDSVNPTAVIAKGKNAGTVGTVTSVATTSPITGGTITTTGTIACPTCLTAITGNNPLATVGGFIGTFINNSTAVSNPLFSTANSTAGRSVAPFVMYLGGLSVCISAAQNANSIQSAVYGKRNPAATQDIFDLVHTNILPGSVAGCYSQKTNIFPVNAGEVVLVETAGVGTVQTLLGAAANIYGTTSQWLGNYMAVTVAGTTTVYTGPGQGVGLATTTETLAAMPVVYSSTAKNLCVWTTTAQPANNSMDITLFDNGVATALTTTIPLSGAAGLRCDYTHTASLTAGHWFTWEIKNNANTTSANVNEITMELVPSGNATAFINFPRKGDTYVASVNNYTSAYAFISRSTTETAYWAPIPRIGNIVSLSCFVTTAPTNTVTVTVQKNGSPTSITGTFGSGVSLNVVTSIWTGSVAFAAGDAITLNIATGAVTQPVISACSSEFD